MEDCCVLQGGEGDAPNDFRNRFDEQSAVSWAGNGGPADVLQISGLLAGDVKESRQVRETSYLSFRPRMVKNLQRFEKAWFPVS